MNLPPEKKPPDTSLQPTAIYTVELETIESPDSQSRLAYAYQIISRAARIARELRDSPGSRPPVANS